MPVTVRGNFTSWLSVLEGEDLQTGAKISGRCMSIFTMVWQRCLCLAAVAVHYTVKG